MSIYSTDSLIEQLVEFFNQLLEGGSNFFDDYSDFKGEIDALKEGVEGALEPISDSVACFKMLKELKSVPDQIFIKKFLKYCKGTAEIPAEKRDKYLKLATKESLNEDVVFILSVINRVEELSKIEYIVKLLEARFDGRLSDSEWKRLSVVVDRTMMSDLLYLQNNLTRDYVKGETIEEQGLLTSGVINFSGLNLGDFQGHSHNNYNYSEIAHKLHGIIFP